MTQFDTSFGDKIAEITGPRQTVFFDQALTHAVHTSTTYERDAIATLDLLLITHKLPHKPFLPNPHNNSTYSS